LYLKKNKKIPTNQLDIHFVNNYFPKDSFAPTTQINITEQNTNNILNFDKVFYFSTLQKIIRKTIKLLGKQNYNPIT